MIAIKSYIKTHLITSGRKSTQMTLTERGPVVHIFEKERVFTNFGLPPFFSSISCDTFVLTLGPLGVAWNDL